MTYIARHFGAALICAFLWLSVSTAQAAESDCQLIFEAIPSKDAGPIIGPKVTAGLASKNFADWRAFTQRQATAVAGHLTMNFGNIATFGKPFGGTGGFEGRSSPNAFITVGFGEELQGNALGEAISVITAAVGYMLIQDGTVAYCEEPVGESGSTTPLYSVLPKQGFKLPKEDFEPEDGYDFTRAVYGAIVAANDDLNIGYTFTGKRMLMLDIGGGLTDKLDKTNDLFENAFAAPVSIEYHKVTDQPSIYIANNWVEDPKGLSLLMYNSIGVRTKLRPAQKAYIVALRTFAGVE